MRLADLRTRLGYWGIFYYSYQREASELLCPKPVKPTLNALPCPALPWSVLLYLLLFGIGLAGLARRGVGEKEGRAVYRQALAASTDHELRKASELFRTALESQIDDPWRRFA